MIRLLLLVLYAGFVYGVSFGQANFETREKEIYKHNKVKHKLQWSYDYVNGNPAAKGYVSQITTFDMNGNTIDETSYKSNGAITSVVAYTYDEKGIMKSFSRYSGNKEKLTYNQIIVTDNQGNKIVESGFDGLSKFTNNFSYDTGNHLIEISYITDKVLTEKRTFKYTGNVTEMIVMNGNHAITSREISTYDNKKNIIEEVKYMQDQVTQKSNYMYDPNGKRVEETKQNFGNFLYRRKYTYDSKGNVLKITEEKPAGTVYDAYVYKYDAMSNVIEERWTKDNASEYSRKLNKYDDKGLLSQSDCYFASYKFSVLYIFTYEFY